MSGRRVVDRAFDGAISRRIDLNSASGVGLQADGLQVEIISNLS